MNDENAVKILAALAQSTRFNVFRLLIRKGPSGLSAGAIAKELKVAQNTLSTHLNILTAAGIITYTREGRALIYRSELQNTKNFMDYLVTDCCEGQPELCSFGK